MIPSESILVSISPGHSDWFKYEHMTQLLLTMERSLCPLTLVVEESAAPGSHLSCHTVSCMCASIASVVSNSMDCVACQDSLSMGFSRQEYWSGLPGSPPRELLDPGFEPVCLTSPALEDVFFTTGKPPLSFGT